MNTKYSCIFFGTPEFAKPSLTALHESADIILKAVVSQPAKPSGRGRVVTPTPVSEYGASLGYEVLTYDKITPDVIEALSAYNADFAVVVAYGLIVPKKLIDIFQFGMINVHPSLLPLYRGASPLQAPILAGDSESGISIMCMDEKMDHGPILAQQKITLDPNIQIQTWHDSAAQISANLLVSTIREYVAGVIQPVPQNHTHASYTKQISKQDGQLDWTKSNIELDRIIRAYTGWPGAYTLYEGKRLLIEKATPTSISNHNNPVPGTVFISDSKIYITCGQGSLELQLLKPENKKTMPVASFVNGNQNFIGTRLGI